MPDPTSTAAKKVYRLGEFEVYPDSGELFRDGVPVRVQEQSFQVLLALIGNPGSVVTRNQLRERLWPDGTYVDFEHSLNAAIKRLRAALGDDAESPRYIETLPKRGYRLMVEVNEESSQTSAASQNEELATRRRRGLQRPLTIATVLVVLAAAVTLAFLSRRRAGFGVNPEAPPPPQNGEAYELYLRSLTYKLEIPANAQAIQLLERSTALDPHSARSWHELARRYDIEFLFAGRGRGFFQQAREANRRALEIAPDFPPARSHKVMLDVEGGQVVQAYHAAVALTHAHPQDAYAHFALSYALRHGGMFEESAQECDLALKFDPANAFFRSCSLVYVLLGRSDRARMAIDLDPLSFWARFRRMDLAIMGNDRKAALEAARSIPVGPHDYADARMMEAALSGAATETVQRWSRETEAIYDRMNLPEAHFVDARYQSYAGQTEPALRLLRRAIANNYCSYPVMDTDPLLANIRRLPEYKELQDAGIACRENFRAQMQER